MDHLDLHITRIEKENDFTKSFYLESLTGPIEYRAGQFLTFLFMRDQHELRRSYSFSSAPGIDKNTSITVKRIVNGEISRHFHDRLKVGDKLKALPASGRFIVDGIPSAQRQFFFISAGSGIVPVFSLIKQLIREEPLSEIILLNQNHDEDTVIFSAQLNSWQREIPNRIRIINLLSNPHDKSIGSHRLTNELLETMVSKWANRAKEICFYLCGPEAFMRMAQFTLRLLKFEDRQIRREFFTVQFIPPPPLALDPGPKKVTVDIGGRKFQFNTSYPKTILQSALDQGIQLPYSCRGARCSTCMAKCISGNVKMSMNEVLTDDDLQDGWVLTCVGYASSDLRLIFGT
jgi:ring-1,2-phenylacetyl-CoA epoxidase subunit PaaE